jgi:hypothetical protein
MSNKTEFLPEKALTNSLNMIGLSGEKVYEGEVNQCATFLIPSRSLFVRVGRPGAEDQAHQNIKFATAMAQISDHILAPTDVGSLQPFITEHGLVTFWPLLDEDKKAPVDFKVFGEILKQIHNSDPKAHNINFYHKRTPTGIAKLRIDKYAKSKLSTKQLVGECHEIFDEIERLLSETEPFLNKSIIHGDANPQNFLTTHDQKRYLVDYDSAGIGSTYWDLAPLVVQNKRFDLTRDSFEDFIYGYGSSEHMDNEHFKKVVRVRELGVVTAIIERAATSPIYSEELAFRIETLNDPSVRWTTLDKLNRHALEQGGEDE